jgi:hypothetical protein
VVYPYTKRKAPLSKKQVDAQLQFSKAVRLAREALASKSERKKFKKIAKRNGHESTYSAAIAYFMLKK